MTTRLNRKMRKILFGRNLHLILGDAGLSRYARRQYRLQLLREASAVKEHQARSTEKDIRQPAASEAAPRQVSPPPSLNTASSLSPTPRRERPASGSTQKDQQPSTVAATPHKVSSMTPSSSLTPPRERSAGSSSARKDLQQTSHRVPSSSLSVRNASTARKDQRPSSTSAALTPRPNIAPTPPQAIKQECNAVIGNNSSGNKENSASNGMINVARHRQMLKARMWRILETALQSHKNKQEIYRGETHVRGEVETFPGGRHIYLGLGRKVTVVEYSIQRGRKINLYLHFLISSIWSPDQLAVGCLDRTRLKYPAFENKPITEFPEKELQLLYCLYNDFLVEVHPEINDVGRAFELRNVSKIISQRCQESRYGSQ